MATKKAQEIPAPILKRLELASINYGVLGHRTVFTAYDAAATLRRKPEEIVKALLVIAGPQAAIAIMAADKRLDIKKLTKAFEKKFGKAKSLKIPNEAGALKITKQKSRPVTAFGSFYKLPVFIDQSLAKRKTAIFPAASFNMSVEMNVKDFIKTEAAEVAVFGQINKNFPKLLLKKKVVKKKKTSKKKVVKKKKVIKKKKR